VANGTQFGSDGLRHGPHSPLSLRLDLLVAGALALVMAVPVYFKVADAVVFPFQVMCVSLLMFGYLLRHKARPFSFLDQLVGVYLLWSLAAYAVNIPLLWSEGYSRLLPNQFISLVTLLFTMSPYLLGRCYFVDPETLDRFAVIVAGMFAVVLMFFGWSFAHELHDLFLARKVIDQRIPMMIAFLGWAIGGLAFWTRRRILLLPWLFSLVVVILSLTRAAYVQWAFSGLLFYVVSFMRSRNRLRFVTASLVVIAIFATFLAFSAVYLQQREGFSLSTIQDRAEQLVTVQKTIRTDESANTRLEIWRRLSRKLIEAPQHMVFGYGQLGPSFMSEQFATIAGNWVNVYNAHSQYLDTVIRTGLPGLLLELWLFAVVMLRPFRRLALKPEHTAIFQLHSVALAGVVFYGMFHETLRWQMFGLYFWLYAGIVSAQLYPSVAPAPARAQGPAVTPALEYSR
jgi:O-antigen ligase